MNGIDTPYSTVGKAHELKAAGIDFVMRYCSPNSAMFPAKCITSKEADGLRLAGLRVGLIYERLDTIAEFKDAEMHAAFMLAGAKMCDAPNDLSVCLYAAVDYDAGTDTDMSAIVPHFETLHAALKSSGYLLGVYGSGHIIRALKNRGVVHCGWLAQSHGWSEYDVACAEIIQGKSSQVVGLAVDLNQCPDMDKAGLI